MWQTHISHSGADPYVKGDNLIHCVANPQAKKIKGVSNLESYGCVTVDRE